MKKQISKIQTLWLNFWLAIIFFFPTKIFAVDYLSGLQERVLTDSKDTYKSALILLLIAAAIIAMFSRWAAILTLLGGAFVAGILLFNNEDVANWFTSLG